jgi:anti-anti-sigma factor
MIRTAEAPSARRPAVGDSNGAGRRFHHGAFIFEHEEMPGFRCVQSAEPGGVMRIVVTGELDIATCARLYAALSRPADGTVLVILDLSEVTFIDGAGLGVILQANGRLGKADCRFVISPSSRAVQRLFQITGTEREVDFRKAVL